MTAGPVYLTSYQYVRTHVCSDHPRTWAPRRRTVPGITEVSVEVRASNSQVGSPWPCLSFVTGKSRLEQRARACAYVGVGVGTTQGKERWETRRRQLT